MSSLEQVVERYHLKQLLRGACFDHVAITVPQCAVIHALLRYLGFDTGYTRRAIGNLTTSMTTAVLQAPFSHENSAGRVQIAVMSGNDGTDPATGATVRSQITEYYIRRGSFSVQHIALRVRDIRCLVRAWDALGIRFITSDQKGPYILEDMEDGIPILQCFTFPISEGSGTFFELKQIVRARGNTERVQHEFRDQNVQGLWEHVDRMIRDDILFTVNMFGEPNLEESLRKRSISIDLFHSA